jgi:glycosyltransferase involved in cell wall biosynthesis
MPDRPLVSVLMTAYNREKYIAQSIVSVLKSAYNNFELIIVDDHSQDGTVKIAQSFAAKDIRVKVHVNEQNLGDYPNRNKAASFANGKYLKFLDSDDIIYAHGLTVMINCMEEFPDAGLGFSSKDTCGPLPVALSPRESYIESFFGGAHFDRAPGSVIIKREVFEEVGGFTGKRMIGDYELWMKIAMKYDTVIMPMYLYWSRDHDQQESKSGYANDYKRLRHNVLNEILNNPDCPLTEEEKNKIKNRNYKKELINKLRSFIHSFD